MPKSLRKSSAKGNSLSNDDRNPPLLLNMTKSFRALVVTDLDGTLINDEGNLSETDRATLNMLGQKGVLRVVATGRNYYSAAKVIKQDFPIDYLVVSSGSAILSWPDQTLCAAHHLDRTQVELIANALREKKLDFMLHAAYPNSHYLYFSKNNSDPNPDFYARIKYYKEYVSEWTNSIVPDGDAFTQFLVVEPAEHPSYLESLKSAFEGVKVIQATSPYDHNSRWLEIYSSRVDKGQAAEWVASRHDLTADLTLATGNDTNDVDMLDWAGKSFVVANVTPSIKNKYTNLQCSNNKSAFSEAVSLWMNEIQWE